MHVENKTANTNINISSVVDLDVSDHQCVFSIFYCSGNKCCLAAQVTSKFLAHIARNQIKYTASSVDSLRDAFSKVATALDAVTPLTKRNRP